ncbi:hypothetical protein PUNSTDRAFT_68079, partial [Punctularia strigosozonata HHB-11173 SS5]|uniref:uncharacterized protein n=1 Tax=Punctularia strigosozonata (strain HHB-11173) TaxID=741275 RepID=UPI000441685A
MLVFAILGASSLAAAAPVTKPFVAARQATENSTSTAVAATTTSASSAAAASSSSTDFHLQNGFDAQSLNAKFATLASTDSCTDGEQACVSSSFAQCVGGTWATTQCPGGLSCFALPLVNKAGTSIGCDTQADAEARIAATGATGGLTGSGSSPSSAAAPS